MAARVELQIRSERVAAKHATHVSSCTGPTGAHHYMLPEPNGPTLHGACKHCGATGVWPASTDREGFRDGFSLEGSFGYGRRAS